MQNHKMSDQELGVMLGQQLLGINDFQYGLWNDELEYHPDNLKVAQFRYTQLVKALLPEPDTNDSSVLDVYCGTGNLLTQLLKHGYKVDGVASSPLFSQQIRERLDSKHESEVRIFECPFQDFPQEQFAQHYDAVVFNGSFHQLPLKQTLGKVEKILKPGGLMIVLDFFYDGDQLTNGAQGHNLDTFVDGLEQSPFAIVRDDDLTESILPNLLIMDYFFTRQLKPAGETLRRYFREHYPTLSRIGATLFRKQLTRLENNLLSSRRSEEVKSGAKRFHSIVLQLVKLV